MQEDAPPLVAIADFMMGLRPTKYIALTGSAAAFVVHVWR